MSKTGIERVLHYFELCGRGEVDPIMRLYREDAIFFDCGDGPVEFTGRDDIAAGVFQPLFDGVPDFRVQTVHIDGNDTRVFAEVVLHGTHNGELAGIAASGSKLKWHSAGVWEIDLDGKFTREAYYYDSGSLRKQLLGAEVASS